MITVEFSNHPDKYMITSTLRYETKFEKNKDYNIVDGKKIQCTEEVLYFLRNNTETSYFTVTDNGKRL